MKRWIKRTLVGVLGASAVFGGFAAWAHNHHHHHWQVLSDGDAAAMKARMVDKLGRRLDLDAAQKAKLGLLADALRDQRNALIGSGSGSGSGTDPRAEMQSLIAGPSFDRAKAKAIIDAKLFALTTQSPAVLATLADFYDSLRPDQQGKVRDVLARRGDGRHGGPRS